MNFITKTKNIDGGRYKSSTLKVTIYSVEEDSELKIGEYDRDFCVLHKTFHPFKYKDTYYALYSPRCKETRIMELPSCKDYCAVEGKIFPVEYYVPSLKDINASQSNKELEEIYGTFGFISGCYWGDDSTWKIGYIDLTGLEEKVVKADFRFGYVVQPINLTLPECIDLSDFNPANDVHSFTITRCSQYDMRKHYISEDSMKLEEVNAIANYNRSDLDKFTTDELASLILRQKHDN